MIEIVDDISLINPTLQALKESFLSGKSRPIQFRQKQLQSLLKGLSDMKKQFHEAIRLDLGLNEFNSQLLSLFITEKEIENNIKQIQAWSKTRPYDTPVAIGPGVSYIIPEPLGVVLILSAWNYPVYTAIGPVGPAIAAGNCVVLKPSQMAPASSHVLKKLFEKYLDPNCFRVIEGKVEVAKTIVTKKFDLIIFTGSPQKGRLVAKAAAQNLVPCLLELGGKNPTIVDEDADIQVAAMRISQGRFTNCGQTCVAPDYVIVHKKIKAAFLRELIKATKLMYPNDTDMGRIVNLDHFKRLKSYIQENHRGQIKLGGRGIEEKLFLEPTIIEDPSPESLLMNEQIFGPILPVTEFSDIKALIRTINLKDKPLALYYFGDKNKEILLKETSSGAFVVNDSIFHVVHPELPFGGVGNSGFGAYHGQAGFDNCSHLKPVLQKGTLSLYPLTARFPPFDSGKQNLLLFLLKNTMVGQNHLASRIGILGLLAAVGYVFWSGKYRQILQSLKNAML